MIYRKKNYLEKTAQQWLVAGKWTAFLMRVPLNRTTAYTCDNANYIERIKVTASQLSNNPDCDRRFSISANLDMKSIAIKATLK